MMNIRNSLFVLGLLALLAGCGGPGDSADVPEAEPAGSTSVDIGNHVVHFSAQSTDQLPPEVARAYNIVRSKNRAMLTVSLQDKSSKAPVAGLVEVSAVNLTGQLKSVTMRQVEEGDAIYYIGDIAVANQETLIFDISVTPEGAAKPAAVRFKRQFYSE